MIDSISHLNQSISLFIKENFPEKVNSFVLGHGKTDSPTLMLVGEAPGLEEVKLGLPFVGRAGKNLDFFLESINVSRNNLYITNIVKYRPTKIGKSKKPINRSPTLKEIQAFIPLLLREIKLIKPLCLVSLGNTPLYALTGKKNIGNMHGIFYDFSIEDIILKLFPMYHPAALIYNQSLKDVYESDILKLAAWLKENVPFN